MGSTKACREHFMRQLASTRESLLSACGGHFSSSGSRDLQYWNTEISLISYIYIYNIFWEIKRGLLSLSLSLLEFSMEIKRTNSAADCGR